MIQRFHRIWKFLTPSWLQGGDGERVLLTLGTIQDAFVERIREGLEARMPTRAGASSNLLTAGDRRLLKGRNETNLDFIARMLAWRLPRTHRVRGNAYEALLQIWHYWGGIYAALVDSHGRRHIITSTDVPDVDTLDNPDILDSWTGEPFGDSTSWDGNSADVHWSRFWVILQAKASDAITAPPDLGDPDLWGGALGTPGFTLGQVGVTPEDVTAMRALFQDLHWGPGNTQPEWLLLGLGPAVQVAPVPNNNWLYWSKDSGGTRVAARTSTLTYTHGANQFQNGTAAMTIPLPSSGTANALLFWHEAQETLVFGTIPTGWTLVAEKAFGTSSKKRVLVRNTLGDSGGADNGTTISYTPVGATDHAIRITAVSAPPEGWVTPVLDNIDQIVTSSAAGSSGDVALPDNGSDEHRLVFISLNSLDTFINVSPNTGSYTEIYDSANEMNQSLYETYNAKTGATLAISAGTPVRGLVSFRLIHNLSWRFWSLDPDHNNRYSGDRSRGWPTAATNVSNDGTYGPGDRSNGSAWDAQPLPDGTMYQGSRASWPTNVLLLDDGSVAR